MAQFRELQCVHWGPLPPDTIPLVTSGINVAAGPNGSGKTCALDALKLMLGVEKLKLRPRDWIYNGLGNSSRRADRAYIRVVIENPERPGRRGRLFADVGYGCERSSVVTAICEVSRDGRSERRYTILAGLDRWGDEQTPIEADLAKLKEIPGSRWYGPRQWGEILRRAGVPQALLKVISVRAGETDQMLQGSPQELFRRMLELTGKQQTLDAFQQAKRDLAGARSEHRQAHERLRSERTQLEKLVLLNRRHDEFQAARQRKDSVERVELPLAIRFELSGQIEERQAERSQREEANDRHRETLEILAEELPRREQEQEARKLELEQLRATQTDVREQHTEAAGDEREARRAYERAEQLLALDQEPSAETLAEREQDARRAEHELSAAEERRQALLGEQDDLRTGRPVRPVGLDGFRTVLAQAGIESALVAEQLEFPDDGPVAEALLGRESVWALVVAAEQLERSVALAREHGHRLPVVAAGDGVAMGALAGASGLDQAGAWLAELDLPLGEDAGTVSGDGIVRGRSFAHFRAPERPVLGAGARERALALVEEELAKLAVQLPRLGELAISGRAIALRYAEVLAAFRAKPELERALAEAAARLEQVSAHGRELDERARDLSGQQAGAERDLARRREEEQFARSQIADNETRIARLGVETEALQAELQALPAPQEDVEVAARAVLEAELAQLELRLEEGFTEEERSPTVPLEREKQASHVEEAELVLGEHDSELARAQDQLGEARRRYEQHVRESVHRLGRSFRDVCAKANMSGEMKLVADESEEGEHTLSVRVAHEPDASGEALAPYQSGLHSDGQRAKISILLLLAAMGSEGASDMLIMDEHSAHLDSANSDYIGEAMRALADQVQFILATPVTAEAARAAAWCDHQLAFYPAAKGDPYARLSIFTRRVLAEADPPRAEKQLDLAS